MLFAFSFILLAFYLWEDLFVQTSELASPLFNYFTTNDTKGQDRDMIQELSLHVRKSLFKGICPNTTQFRSLKYLNEQYITNLTLLYLPIGGYGIVSIPRKRATALLTKAALTLSHGDIVETGCYFGTSASIILQILKDFDACHKKIWVFDSFAGLPLSTKEDKYQGTQGLFHSTEEIFKQNLNQTGLYDENRLIVTKGWFNETCAPSPVQKISFLRLDGDLYSSTWDALVAFYHRVVPGGYIYVDDYGSFYGCKAAVDRFRTMHKICDAIHYINEVPMDSMRPSVTFESIWWVKSTAYGRN